MNSVDTRTTSFFNRIQWIALIAGVVGFALAVAGGLLQGFNQFFQSYLVSFVDWTGLSLGALALLMVHFVGGGRWAGTIRRILEAATKTIWLMALLFIPIGASLGYLYIWDHPAAVAASAPLQWRSGYNNAPFFILRTVILFAIWFILVYLFARWSRQEEAGDLNARRRAGRLSAAGLIIFFLTVTVAGYDWILSIFANWSSSVFGLLLAVTQGLAAMAFALLLLPAMPGFRAGEVDERSLKKQLFRDLGALELTLVVLWAYMSYFQFLIIWAGNIPRETDFYLVRSQNGWLAVTILIALVQFVLPFLALIPMRVRSNTRLLSLIGLIILTINYVYYYWIIIPTYYPAGFHISWIDIVMPIAMGGLWVAAFAFHLKRRSLQPYWDMPMPTEPVQEVQQ